jgi:hypothetical protein
MSQPVLLDANGRTVPTGRCGCGRHRMAVDAVCCSACGTGLHTSACNIRQESFPDTRRGVVVSEDARTFRVRRSIP